jgi:hypothetical protein
MNQRTSVDVPRAHAEGIADGAAPEPEVFVWRVLQIFDVGVVVSSVDDALPEVVRVDVVRRVARAWLPDIHH